MRRIQIVDEAFKLFARQGYGSTTMQQIGDAVGLDKSSLYVHFKNKNEIYSVILSAELEAYKQGVFPQELAGRDFKDAGRGLILNTLTYFKDKDKLLFWKHVMLMSTNNAFAEIAEQVGSVLYELNNCLAQKLQSTVSSTDDSVKKRKMAFCLFILSQGLMDWLVLQDKVEDKEIEVAMDICNNILDTSELYN